jgi:dihydroorotase-like cyclic amidohydrolase
MGTPASGQRIHISGGRVIDPANGIDDRLDVYIADGRIAAVGTAPGDFAADHDIDAAGCVVCPGLVDLCAHLRERQPVAASPPCVARRTPCRWWKHRPMSS